MAYVPPNKRNNSNKNTFHVTLTKKNTKSQSKLQLSQSKSKSQPLIVDSVESFPTLGSFRNETITPSSPSGITTNMNYASSLFIPQPKEEIIKEIPDGWIHIRKNKNPKFLVGEHSERYYDISQYVDYMKEIRIHNAYYNMIERHEYYQDLDEELNGPTYVNAWELDAIKKDQELEDKLAMLDEAPTSDDSSEDEITYDYN